MCIRDSLCDDHLVFDCCVGGIEMSLTYLINKFSDLSNFSVFTCHAFCDGLKFVSQAGHSRNDYRNLVSLVIIASNELPNLFYSLPISHRGAAEFHYVSHFTLTLLAVFEAVYPD